MSRKIILLAMVLTAAITCKISCKGDESNVMEFQPSQNLSQENSNTVSVKDKAINVSQINQKIQALSIKLDQLLARVKNDKEKKSLVKLIQNFGVSESCNCATNSDDNQINLTLPSAKQSNQDSFRKDFFDVAKNLTSRTQVVAFAMIASLAILKKTLETGKVTEALKEIRGIVEGLVSFEKIKLIGQGASYVFQLILSYVTLGYIGVPVKPI